MQKLILAMGDAGATDALIAAFNGLSNLLTLLAENADILSVSIVALTARAILPMAFALGKTAVTAATSFAASLTTMISLGGATTTTMGLAAGAVKGLYAALGPFTLAVAAASTAYLVLARSTETTAEVMERANRAASDFERQHKAIESDVARLTGLQKDLSQAIEGQQVAIAETKRADISALEERIAKNKELLAVQGTAAKLALVDARAALKKEEGGLVEGLTIDRKTGSLARTRCQVSVLAGECSGSTFQAQEVSRRHSKRFSPPIGRKSR